MYSQTHAQFCVGHWFVGHWSGSQWRMLTEVIDGATPRVGLMGEFWVGVEMVAVFELVVSVEGSWG
jgi:hypothetical protein